jgi:predicted acetyltransferase
VEIREYGPEEEERASYIGRQAFAHGSRGGSSWMADPNCPTLTSLGVYDEGGMQARLNIIHYQVHLGADVVVPMGGIGGVACLPASRGKGYVGALLTVTLERMRDLGMAISSLYPFSWDFYHRYGWEWVGLTRNYSVPTRVLKPSAETEKVRASTPADRAKIEACYTEFAKRYRGMLAREEKRWNDILKDTDENFTFTFLYEHDGKPEAYLSYHGGTGDETHLNEFIALTPRARRAMLGLLRRHEMQTRKFTWHSPGDDTLYHQLCHDDVETKLFPTTQGRIVDVQRALGAWKTTSEAPQGGVNIKVADEHAPWNAGVWRVEIEAGQATVKRTDAPPNVSLSIQALSQAYYGTPTVAEIRDAEHIEVHDESGYATFRALFDGPPMWTCDGF